MGFQLQYRLSALLLVFRRSVFARATAADNEDEDDDDAPKRQGGRSGRGRGRKPPPDDDSPRVDAEGFQERLLQVNIL